MVTSPAHDWRLPDAPATLGTQIEASFALWLRSVRATLPFSLAYSLGGLLPLLAFGDAGVRLLRVAGNIVVYAFDPTQPEPVEDPAALGQALWQTLTSPAMLALAALAALLALYGVTGLMLRQQRIAHGDDRGLADAAVTALRRLPRAFAAWLVYALIMLACTAALMALAAFVLVSAFNAGTGSALLMLALVFVAGSVILAIPLAWTSVAFAYAPVLASIDGSGPVAAHVASARLVRGHWVRAATVMTVPMLVYLGVGSTISSTVYVVLGLIVLYTGGLAALLEGSWLGWAPWLTALPMALGLPLAFSGLIVSLHDLKQAQHGPG